jgi:hypothetical protein
MNFLGLMWVIKYQNSWKKQKTWSPDPLPLKHTKYATPKTRELHYSAKRRAQFMCVTI